MNGTNKVIGVIVDNDFINDIRVLKEVEILLEFEYEIHVLCFGFIGKEYEEVKGIKTTRIWITQKRKNQLFFFFNRLPIYEGIWRNATAKFILKNEIEVIHTHDLYMAKAVKSGIIKSKRNCPLILDLHENYPEAIQSYNWTKGFPRNILSAPKKWKKKEGRYLKYADKIITLSEKFKIQLWEKYDFLKVEDIFTFANIIDFRKFENFKIDKSIKKKPGTTFFYFGAIAERRGIFDVIKAVTDLQSVTNDINLLIIGPIDKSDKIRFNQVIKSDFISYIPWINLAELLSYLNVADVCLAPFHVNPQHESGVANKIYQYMFGKKPLIVSNCQPQRELIQSFNSGLVFKNQKELKECILYLSNNPKKRIELGENGYKALYKNFDSPAFKEQFNNVYLSL